RDVANSRLSSNCLRVVSSARHFSSRSFRLACSRMISSARLRLSNRRGSATSRSSSSKRSRLSWMREFKSMTVAAIADCGSLQPGLSPPATVQLSFLLGAGSFDAAVFEATGRIARSFLDIEEHARAFQAKMDKLLAGAVVAVQIGNHKDWPAVFIACLRKQLVVLPLDQSIGEQQRDAALEICRASALVSAVPSENSPQVIRLRTADTTTDWGENVPSLLKLTSGT